jgi:hypothetical protein
MDWKFRPGTSRPNFGFPPNARDIMSKPAVWKSIGRSEAVSRFRHVPVVVVEIGGTGATARWFNESSPFYSTTGRFRSDALRYYAYIGGAVKATAPRAPSRRASEPELEPMLPEPEPEPASEFYWVELDVQNEGGGPAGGVVYAVELPDGSIRKGRLDSQGRAKVQSPVQGQYKVSFPGLDASAWEPA